MDIPSLFMIPSAVSSGKVHSVFPNSTDADFDFNRDSDATRVNSEGLIERVGYYGSELITNGSFDTDSAWNKLNATISGGKGNLDGVGQTALLWQTILTQNKFYKVTFTISNYNGQGQGRLMNNDGGSIYGITSNGTFTIFFQHTIASGNFLFRAKDGAVYSIDNVSVKEVTGDRARLNYEIEGGLVNTKPSLLLEPQSTNLFTKSNDVDATAATKLDNQITSPEGLENAALYVENTATASHGAIKSAIFPTAGATTYTLSVFAKAKERHLLRLNLYADGTSNLTDNFDLINGTVSDANSTIEDFGNGWFRCSTTKTVTNSGGYNFAAVYMGKATNNYYYAGDGQSGLYLFGFQLEQQSYATSYIPTNGSTQTRAGETCNGAGTSSILPTQGILFTEVKVQQTGSTNGIIFISNGTTSNFLMLRYAPSHKFQVEATGGVNIIEDSARASGRYKVAVKYSSAGVEMWIDGSKAKETSTATTATGINELGVGSSPYGNIVGCNVFDARIYNTKEMTDSEVDILLTKITS